MTEFIDLTYTSLIVVAVSLFFACALQTLRLIFVLYINPNEKKSVKICELLIFIWFMLAFIRISSEIYYISELLSVKELSTLDFICCLAVTSFLFLRCIYLLSGNVLNARHRITLISVKEALETMPDGIAFSRYNGTPLIVNSTMDKLALCITGEHINNLNKLYDMLSNLEDTDNIKKIPVSGDLLAVDIAEYGAWLFRRDILELHGKNT